MWLISDFRFLQVLERHGYCCQCKYYTNLFILSYTNLFISIIIYMKILIDTFVYSLVLISLLIDQSQALIDDRQTVNDIKYLK